MSHTINITAPCAGAMTRLEVKPGDTVAAGDTLAIIEIMKMQQAVDTPVDGTVGDVFAVEGETVQDGRILMSITASAEQSEAKAVSSGARSDLAELEAVHNPVYDASRPEAVAKRAARGGRTARANVDDLLDSGSFREYGALAVAAQSRRRLAQDLIEKTPADGIVTGFGTVEDAPVAVLAYDYTVLAGTQGYFNHKKTDRVLDRARAENLPIIFYTEGGGGRPGDIDAEDIVPAGLNVPTFATYAACAGPRIAVNHGRCFAGNAVLFGTSDITIATKASNIGMAGPAMIAGAGLGHVKPEDIGPIEVQAANGVVDIIAADEADATRLAKKALSYFTHRVTNFDARPTDHLRRIVPENRIMGYDMRALIGALCDADSVLELGRDHARGMITALVRLGGYSFGLYANNPTHLAGAIDAEGAEKAARFIHMCDRFRLPLIALCDTPGFMVGPEYEVQGSVRRTTRLLRAAANISVPVFTVVTRKGYGLGAMAMAAGGFGQDAFVIAWPTGEFGAMGLEGAVRLGFRKELEAESDPDKRKALFETLLARQYAAGKAVAFARKLEIDAVIDPADTRDWILSGLIRAGANTQN